MGCGKVYDDIDPLPDSLIGSWKGAAGVFTGNNNTAATDSGLEYIFAGNQASTNIKSADFTISGSLAEPTNGKPWVSFRIGISYIGDSKKTIDKDSVGSLTDDGKTVKEGFEIDFYDFTEKKNNLRGTIRGYRVSDTEVEIIASEAENLYYLIPPVGKYTISN